MRSLVSSVLQSTSDIIDDPFKLADEALRRENERLNNELSLLRMKLIELEQMADMDPLVPLNNRRAFMRELSRAQTVRMRYKIPSAIIYFDLDQFKSVNDRYGHNAGDRVLKCFADVLQANIRDCDIAARIGGDEFTVLLFKSDTDQAMTKAVTITQAARETCEAFEGLQINLTVSWGVADCVPNLDPEEILAKADKQMFSCKSVPQIKYFSAEPVS